VGAEYSSVQVAEVMRPLVLLSRARTAGWAIVLLRLARLTMTTAFSFLGLLSRTDRDKEIEILVLRHHLMMLQRQAGKARVHAG
jgi:hypothetical protein